MARYWSHEPRCGVKIVTGSYKRPSSIPGVTTEKSIVKTCRFGGEVSKLGIYETNDPIEITALEQLPLYGGVMGTGEGANRVPGVSHLFFRMMEDAIRPSTAREMNQQLHKDLKKREDLIAKAIKLGVRAELGNLSDADIQALIDKQFAQVKAMMNEQPEMSELPVFPEAKEAPALVAPKKNKGGRPKKNWTPEAPLITPE